MSDNSSISLFNPKRGSSTPYPLKSKKVKSVYRSTFATLKMRITEGFLKYEPTLHPDIKSIIKSTPCIPLKLKEKVFSFKQD